MYTQIHFWYFCLIYEGKLLVLFFFLIEITFKGTKLVIIINYGYNIYKLSLLSLSGDIITIIDFSIESLCI